MIPSRPTGAALWTTRLDRGSPVSLSRQLAAALRQSIAEGSLAAGADAEERVQNMLESHGLAPGVRVTRSEIPYRG